MCVQVAQPICTADMVKDPGVSSQRLIFSTVGMYIQGSGWHFTRFTRFTLPRLFGVLVVSSIVKFCKFAVVESGRLHKSWEKPLVLHSFVCIRLSGLGFVSACDFWALK